MNTSLKYIFVIIVFLMLGKNAMAEKIIQTAGRAQLGEFAPEFAHYNDDVLFGENWNNKDIDLKTRSIITIVSIITHTAFYVGWPKAWAVFGLAKEIWNDKSLALSEKDKYQQSIMFPIGSPNDAYAQYFIGQSYLAPISTEQVKIFNVTFEPKCRNNWHTHHAKVGGGQMLIGVGGRGYYQEWGKAPVEIKKGTVIHIPANVKHWHGAAPNSWFSHLAIEIDGEELSNEWLEPVSEDEYSKLE